MSTNESLPPSFNAVKPKLIHLSPLIEFFYDPLQLGRNLVPKSVNSQNLLSWLLNRSLALTLDVVEQLFDWVQPWRVLRIQQDVHFEPTGSLVDLRMLVNAGVVHQYHDLLRLVSVSTRSLCSTRCRKLSNTTWSVPPSVTWAAMTLSLVIAAIMDSEYVDTFSLPFFL